MTDSIARTGTILKAEEYVVPYRRQRMGTPEAHASRSEKMDRQAVSIRRSVRVQRLALDHTTQPFLLRAVSRYARVQRLALDHMDQLLLESCFTLRLKMRVDDVQGMGERRRAGARAADGFHCNGGLPISRVRRYQT